MIRCQCPHQTIIACHLDLPPKSTFISRLIRWTHMKVECLFRNAWEYLRIGEASGQHPPGLLRWEQGQGEPAVIRRRRLRQYLWDHNQHTQTLLRTPPTLMCQVCVTMNILTMFKPKIFHQGIYNLMEFIHFLTDIRTIYKVNYVWWLVQKNLL